jgi:hypothetical protein
MASCAKQTSGISAVVFGILLGLVSVARADPGDIRSMRVLGDKDYGGIFNGWAIEIGIEGLSPGGKYDLGLGRYNSPARAKVVGLLQGWEFDEALEPSHTLKMTLYGTTQLRRPHPNQRQNYETMATKGLDGYEGVKIIVALSEYIYVGDALSFGVKEGLYTQGDRANRVADGIKAANRSTLTCPKAVANWSWPGYRRFNDDITLRAIGFHGDAREGKSLKLIRFTIADSSDPRHTVTQDVQVATIDKSLPDANPVIEYVATVASATLQAGGISDGPIVCNFRAFPMRTDAEGNGILDTSDGVNKGVTWKYSPQANYYDAGGKYGVLYAVVDAAGGNDETGKVGPDLNAADKTPFATIQGAAGAMAEHNRALAEPYKRDNASGGVIHLKKGTHSIGAAVARYRPPRDPDKSDVWLEITPYPGVARSDVTIGSDSATAIHSRVLASQLVRFADVTFARTSKTDNDWWLRAHKAVDALWLDHCIIDNTTSAASRPGTFHHFGLSYLTHSQWSCGPFDIGIGFAFQRGNTISGGGAIGRPRVIVGNTAVCGKDNKANTCIAGSDESDGCILAFNRLMDQRNGNNVNLDKPYKHGVAVVQNLFERSKQTQHNTPVMSIAVHGAPAHNVIVFHNTMLGERANMAYNNAGTNSIARQPWFERNNIMYRRAYKSDLFHHANGNRTGNWPVGFGTAMGGNVYSSFRTHALEKSGINCAVVGPTTRSTVEETFGSLVKALAFVDFKAQSAPGANDGESGGDYHLTGRSVAIGRAHDWILPYDLDGKPRKKGGAAGVYEYFKR